MPAAIVAPPSAGRRIPCVGITIVACFVGAAWLACFAGRLEGRFTSSSAPYQFSPEGVIWVIDGDARGPTRAAAHWPIDLAITSAPRDPRFPTWALWPRKPGQVVHGFAAGWPFGAFSRDGQGSVSHVLLGWALCDFFVLWALSWAPTAAAWYVLACVASALAAINSALSAKLGSAPPDPNLCVACGYDLRGLPESFPCPECGGRRPDGHAEPTAGSGHAPVDRYCQ